MLISIQLGDKDRQFVIDTRYVSIGPLASILSSTKIVKLGVNLKFDYKMIKHHLGIELNNIYDIGLAELILTNGLNKLWSLAAIAKKYLDIDLNTKQLSLWESYVSKDTVKLYENLKYENLTLDLIKYSATDIIIPSLIYPKILKQIRETNQAKVIKLENDFTTIVAKWELKGIYLDADKWLNVLADNKLELSKVEQQLNLYLISQKLEHYLGINWNSSKQVSALFKELDIPIQVIDSKNSVGDIKVYKNTVGQAHIKKFKSKFDILPLYLSYKNLYKAISTYGFKFLSNVNPISNRIHTNIYQIKSTGRISSSSPNLQNIPRTADFRSCFIAPKGKTFIICDYSAQESRILADYAKEPAMIDFAINGDGDFHSLTAKQMYGEVTPENRPIAKMLNFAIAYGASAHKISDQAQIPTKQAQELIDQFFKSYPVLKPYFEKVQRHALSKGYHITDAYTKRRCYIENFDKYKTVEAYIKHYQNYYPSIKLPSKIWSIYFKMKGEIERDSQNYPIQGTGGSMTKLAAVLIDKAIIKLGWKERAYIVNIIHDEIVVECDTSIANKLSKIVSKCMQEAGKTFIKSVPMPAEVHISEFWKK